MVYGDRPFVTAGSATDPAAIAVPLEDDFTQSAEVSLVLTAERKQVAHIPFARTRCRPQRQCIAF